MRPCRPYDEPSSVDDIKDTQAAFDESGDNAACLKYISALIRSDSTTSVKAGLERVRAISGFDETLRSQIEYLTVLALYRLKYDKECIERATQAKDANYATKKTLQIREALLEIEKQNNIAVGVGVGIGAAAVLAGVLGIIFGRKKH